MQPNGFPQAWTSDPISLLRPVIPGCRRIVRRGYDVDAPPMPFQLHEWDIHIV